MRALAIVVIIALAGFSGWLLYKGSYIKTQYWYGSVQMEDWRLQELHELTELLEEQQVEEALLKLRKLREDSVTRIAVASRNFAPESDYAVYAKNVACEEIKSWQPTTTPEKCQ